ncbi:uncharacterized protein LAESUDRAFT_629493, partial [Laetiporus sulphureus 93-53]
WFWRILMLLCSWLYLQYHLPFRACALILQVLRIIFVALGLIDKASDTPITLTTSMNRLALTDQFEVKAMCPACHRLYPANSPPDLQCSKCSISIFKPSNSMFSDAVDETQTTRMMSTPKLQVPYSLLSEQLPGYVTHLEESIDSWRLKGEPRPGAMRGVYDGKLWSSLPGPPGQSQPFFYNGPDRLDPTELRIAVTISFDGFVYQRSQFAGKHSTGVLSNCIANLDTEQKYQSRNLILCGLSPGPRELTGDELQLFLEEYVTDLLLLFEHGIVVKTPLFPEGRRVRVILIGVICDHPALCRMCGFGDHNTKTAFCTKCKIPRDQLSTQAGMSINAFPPRNEEEHRRHALEYQCETDSQKCDELFALHAVRFYELSRLPYFDAVRMSIIDPMHNILLGIVKTQWLNVWIDENALRERTKGKKVKRELDQVHEYLANFEMPRWVARLPSEIGYPAGGSLTADEWKGLVLNYGPVVVPLIWQEWQPSAEKAYQKAVETWKKKEEARKRRIDKGKRRVDGTEEAPASKPKRRMHADDADNFLSFATALKLILARTVYQPELDRARVLLEEYLQGYQRVHPDKVKPNFHYVTHIFDQIDDYGPVYGFWSFLSERLNKVLKSYSTNNHDGG